mgnify:CR=1 FL=1
MPGNYETMKILGSLYSNSEDMEKKEIAKVLFTCFTQDVGTNLFSFGRGPVRKLLTVCGVRGGARVGVRKKR